MAKKRPEDPPKGAPAWQATFSDLMNLLLCFFVLLFSMSTVDAQKFEMIVASLQSSMSILPAGGSSIGDGDMVAAGVNQLEFLDSYYNDTLEKNSIVFVGDGSLVYKSDIEKVFLNAEFASEELNILNSYSLALAGLEQYRSGFECKEVLPLYLKKPQAQRQLEEKEKRLLSERL